MKNIGRILGYGIPSKNFNDKFDLLPEDKKELLERVARRLQVIIKLNYEALFLRNPFANDGTDFIFGRWELSSIQIYLYCTCIDTLASKIDGKYLDFYQWLKAKNSFHLDSKNIDENYQKYLDEYGDKKNFSKIFDKLSPNVKFWLNQNVAIQESKKDEVAPERNEEKLIKHLTDYFYLSWRNPFTHQSVTRPADFFPDINSLDEHYLQYDSLSHLAEREWFCQPFEFELNKEKGKWYLWHKKDIDLAVILRIIIQTTVFKWLEIDITEDLINKIAYRALRLYWLYTYIHEIRANAKYLESWKDISEKHSDEYLSKLRSFGVPRLSSVASSKIIEFFHSNNIFENQLREGIQKYLQSITYINTLIAKLNKEYPRLDKYDRETENKNKNEIKAFLLELTTHSEYIEIIKRSRRFPRIWELIRDNSEYESKNIDLPIGFTHKIS